MTDYAWIGQNSGLRTHEVGTRRPNPWGLYDMNGNVLQWCSDWYDKGYYAVADIDDPKGPNSGHERVLRGGDWYNGVYCGRSSNRIRYVPGEGWVVSGFRVAFLPADKAVNTPSQPSK